MAAGITLTKKKQKKISKQHKQKEKLICVCRREDGRKENLS